MRTTTIRSPGAIALGVILAIGTLVILFWDVRAPGDVTTDHVMTLAMLIVTIAAGHYWLPAVQHRHVFPAIGLAVLFVAGTFIVVTGSAGRGAEVAAHKVAAAQQVNADRRDAQDQLKAAREKREELAERFARECGTGKGGRCKGLREALDAQDSHVGILQVRVERLQPEQEANVRLKHAARVFAFFWPEANVKRVEEGLELAWPFALALIMEFGTVVFFGLGLGHAKRRGPSVAVSTTPPAPPQPRGKRGRKSDPAVNGFVQRFRKTNGRTPSGLEIRNEFPELASSTAYDIAARARNSGTGRNSGIAGASLRVVS